MFNDVNIQKRKVGRMGCIMKKFIGICFMAFQWNLIFSMEALEIAEVTPKKNYSLPILVAAKAGDTDSVASLLENKADIDSTEGEMECTALHLAAMYGHKELLEMLLKKGADAQKSAFCEKKGFDSCH